MSTICFTVCLLISDNRIRKKDEINDFQKHIIKKKTLTPNIHVSINRTIGKNNYLIYLVRYEQIRGTSYLINMVADSSGN